MSPRIRRICWWMSCRISCSRRRSWRPTISAEMLADHVRRLADDVGVPRGLRDLGVTDTDLDTLSVTTLDDACLTTNPRPATRAEIHALFREAL